MNVQQLIDVLQKVEDKSMEVCYTYDGRAGGNMIHCVEIEQYHDDPSMLVFRNESTEDYDMYNHTQSVEEYAKEELKKECPDYWKSLYPTDEDWKQHQLKEIEIYKKSKKRFDNEWTITNLFLESEDV